MGISVLFGVVCYFSEDARFGGEKIIFYWGGVIAPANPLGSTPPAIYAAIRRTTDREHPSEY